MKNKPHVSRRALPRLQFRTTKKKHDNFVLTVQLVSFAIFLSG
jgi:hypothetical protein